MLLGLIVLAALLIYAYGFDVTRSTWMKSAIRRRARRSLVRIIRALFQPDIFEYEREEFQVNAPIYVPVPPTRAPSPPLSPPPAPASRNRRYPHAPTRALK